MLSSASLTDRGVVREVNEDCVIDERTEGLFAVIDGMGGAEGGRVAAEVAAAALRDFVISTRRGVVGPPPFPTDPTWPAEANRIQVAIRVANQAVLARKASTGLFPQMGCTVAAGLFDATWAYLAHVGDSRIYRFRQDRLEKLTIDHTRLDALIHSGQIRPEEAGQHPDKTGLTRAVGVGPDVLPEVRVERLHDGDLYLLCSDGLTDLVSERKLAEIFAASWDADRQDRYLPALARELIDQANRAGGDDNISVVLVEHRA